MSHAAPQKRQPNYLHHKPTNQAYCRIPDGSGGRRVVYLGRFNSPESKLEHARILAELAMGAHPLQPAGSQTRHPDLTMNEVALAFWNHAERYYRRPDGTTTNELVEYRYTLRVLTDSHGGTPAREFGPLALKAVRQRMVDRRWKRSTVNNRVRRIKHLFKWAVENELVPPAVHQALAAVAGLPKGRGYAPEPAPVGPVSDGDVEATLLFVPAVVRAMIRVQRLTGMRPGEVVALRPAEVDASGPVWVYRPRHHKTAHKGRERVVAIGPRAQAVLAE